MNRGVAFPLLALLAAAAFLAAADAQCVGTAERPAHLLTLPQGGTFCLRLPRYLPKPEKALFGSNVFVRTHNDTCGLYSIVMHADDPKGVGPDPHVHYIDEEFFLPTAPGNVVRLFAQSNKAKARIYAPGEVPGWTVPAITDVGHADVPYGQIGYSPVGIPHTFKSATPMKGFIAIWLNSGAAMIPGINIPAMYTDVAKVMGLTSMWAVPTDISAKLFGGPDFVTRGLASKPALPAVTAADLQRLQKALDDGERCFPKLGKAAPGKPTAG